MNINWFEIIAQMINFFILLFLLQKLFYKPVIKAMDDRQQRIRDNQTKSDEKMKKADELIETYHNNLAELEKEKDKQLEMAKQQAEEKKEELIAAYKEEAEQKRSDYMKEVEEEQERFIQDLRASLGHNAVKIAEHILGSFSKEKLSAKVYDSFMAKVAALDEDILREDMASKEECIILISSEELSEQQKESLEKMLKEKVGTYKEIAYEVDEALIQGYELKLETLTVHTNVRKYLEEAEKNVQQLIEKRTA
ncbi:F0F1 ATP synthase subunit delta [Anoxynatronum buryatiense]|uniref:ATP synthase subunit b n=1 Tax=Anoxynatronum buryatiense TaxID=489973 RepID=A0AA45WV74_9CLOT|nr:F0F1 ATP synthase subunit delta [Anoxynatronum buryatiense]SMP52110.1 ATP synthase F0 subcomplex B subunit [Anoxynatronum buryatiense]